MTKVNRIFCGCGTDFSSFALLFLCFALPASAGWNPINQSVRQKRDVQKSSLKNAQKIVIEARIEAKEGAGKVSVSVLDASNAANEAKEALRRQRGIQEIKAKNNALVSALVNAESSLRKAQSDLKAAQSKLSQTELSLTQLEKDFSETQDDGKAFDRIVGLVSNSLFVSLIAHGATVIGFLGNRPKHKLQIAKLKVEVETSQEQLRILKEDNKTGGGYTGNVQA